jgi:antitoxin PrlF
MVTAKVTSKGQITIPKAIREKLGISPGERIGFIEKQGIFTIRKTLPKSPFDRWLGKLEHLKGARSDKIIEDLRGK